MKGLGGLGDMARLMKQAQGQMRQMQKQMGEVDEQLKTRVVEGSAGGGMVKVLLNGLQEPMDVVIDPSILAEGDAEFIQEMILAALRQGLKKSKEIAEEEKNRILGSVGLPGLEKLL